MWLSPQSSFLSPLLWLSPQPSFLSPLLWLSPQSSFLSPLLWLSPQPSFLSPLLWLSPQSSFLSPLQSAVPRTRIDINRPNLDAVFLGVGHKLGGGVETHRLTVEEGGGEGGRIVTLQPGRHIDEQREGSRM